MSLGQWVLILKWTSHSILYRRISVLFLLNIYIRFLQTIKNVKVILDKLNGGLKLLFRPELFLSGSHESLSYFFQNLNKNKSAFTQFYFFLRSHFCVKNEIK